ncbi:unnamed protein product [Urochloa decumbens]|uniref:No apical meristem-associated C-terminal domain-containing protein n=1 Tax=Urochloa decumbens TaxID=240449 RepID=A0ABC9BS17_9POAL
MFRVPLPLGVSTAGIHLVGSGSSPGRMLFAGLDADARPGERTEVNDMSQGDLNSGTYFTNLLGADVDESQDLLPNTHTPIDHGSAASKGSQGRSKNFTDEEDKLLVSAWLNVGMDPIQGVDQPQTTFWARIHDYFHSNKSFRSERTQSSLMSRWSGIQHDVNTFCSCLTRIQDRNQSGHSVDDKIAAACALFKSEDKKHRNFALMHCWRILKDKPKWMERRTQIGGTTSASNKKQKTKANSSPSSLVPVASPATGGVVAATAAPAEDASRRPDGKKTEKKKLRQRSTIEALDYLVAKMKEADAQKDLKKDERCNKAFALQEEKIKLEREKFEFQREQEEERILTLDLSNMTYRLQQYYEKRQDEIFARRCGC